jgi:hypothetical protein
LGITHIAVQPLVLGFLFGFCMYARTRRHSQTQTLTNRHRHRDKETQRLRDLVTHTWQTLLLNEESEPVD